MAAALARVRAAALAVGASSGGDPPSGATSAGAQTQAQTELTAAAVAAAQAVTPADLDRIALPEETVVLAAILYGAHGCRAQRRGASALFLIGAHPKRGT